MVESRFLGFSGLWYYGCVYRCMLNTRLSQCIRVISFLVLYIELVDVEKIQCLLVIFNVSKLFIQYFCIRDLIFIFSFEYKGYEFSKLVYIERRGINNREWMQGFKDFEQEKILRCLGGILYEQKEGQICGYIVRDFGDYF